MPGAAFHLTVLEQTIAALGAGSPADRDKAQIMRDHAGFAQLGALGPDLLRYRPVPVDAVDVLEKNDDLSTLPQQEQEDLARAVQPNPEMAPYALAYRLLLPQFETLTTLEDLFNRMLAIAIAEDTDALKAIQPEFQAAQPALQDLQNIETEGKKVYAAGALAVALGKPALMGSTSLPPPAWRGFEFLRWRGTGTFATTLVKEALNRGDKELIAYGYGWLAHVAASVTGAPFVNSIVNGPYRTHWWRNRMVRNYVDAWTWGRYQTPAAMSGDTATPPYADWVSLYGSNLQDRVRVDAGLTGRGAVDAVVTGAMPGTPEFDKVADLLAAASALAHGGLGPLAEPPAGMADAVALREAYVGALSVLWFMTGDQPIAAIHPGPAPAGAEVPPQWYVDGTQPPAPSGGGGGSATAATISAILAIILGVIAIFAGSIILGAAAVGLAIAAALQGDPVDWDALRRDLYWLRVRIFDALLALQTALAKAGLAYPSPRALGTSTPVTDDSGIALTRGRKLDGYPRRMDSAVDANGNTLPPDSNFRKDPRSPVEQPQTLASMGGGEYADRIIDGQPMLGAGLRGDVAVFPTSNTDFGGAVGNAVDLIRADGDGLPEFNLDGDRGYGWKTWKVRVNRPLSDPAIPVNAEEE